MLPYFPFGLRYNEKMGTAPLREGERLIEPDGRYEAEISFKRNLLAADPDYCTQAPPETETAQWDVLEAVLDDLHRHDPAHFFLKKTADAWHWHNRQLDEETRFVFGKSASLPLPPLDWVGRQTQEDLLVMQGGVLAAGQLCFANDWSLGEKMGKPFLEIHAPVGPVITPMLHAAQTLLERLTRPVWRLNWSFKLSDSLDQSTRHHAALKAEFGRILPTLTPSNLGERVWVRVERQTLSRLPRSGGILFSVRTYQSQLETEVADADRAARILAVLRSAPVELLDYKSVTPFLGTLLDCLEKKTASDGLPLT